MITAVLKSFNFFWNLVSSPFLYVFFKSFFFRSSFSPIWFKYFPLRLSSFTFLIKFVRVITLVTLSINWRYICIETKYNIILTATIVKLVCFNLLYSFQWKWRLYVFFSSEATGMAPFRHRILVYVFRFALILQCTLGAFIVSLNYKFSITFFRNLGERPPQKRNISIAKSQCWAPSNKLLLQNEERYLSISLCNRITFLLK